MQTRIEDVEVLLERFEELDRKEAVMSSIAWSFAMSAGQTILRLNRVWNDDDPTYGEWDHNRRADKTQDLEHTLERYCGVIGWAAAQANPEFCPTGQDVVQRLKTGMQQQEMGKDVLEELAAEFGVSLLEIKQAMAQNQQRFANEQDAQKLAAELFEREVVMKIDAALSDTAPMAHFDTGDARRICERLADKAADYASSALSRAVMQRRARRRQALNAEVRLFRKLEEACDTLLDQYSHLLESVSDASPIEELCASNENDGRDPERGGVKGSTYLTIEERERLQEEAAQKAEAEE